MKLVKAAVLIPVSGSVIREGTLAVDGDRIVGVGPISHLSAQYPDATCEDYSHHALLPGLVNAHTHLELAGYPRRAYDERSSYSKWLLEQDRYKREVPKEFILEALGVGQNELIASGTTTVGDMQSVQGGLPCVAQKGIRAIIFPEISSFDRDGGQDRYERALALIEGAAEGGNRLVKVGLGPYAPYILSRQLLKVISQMARAEKLPVQIHAAETFHEMEFFFDSKGDLAENLFPAVGWGEDLPPPHLRTPIGYLDQIGFLEASPTIVGAAHLASSDIERLAKSGSKLVYCPRSNAYFLQGMAPIRACLDAGIPVALGTEGHASVENLSLWDEMRTVLALHRQLSAPIRAEEILTMATLGGARALGLENEVGSLEVGKKADYIVVECKRDIPPPDHLVEQLILQTYPAQVVQVVVDGKVLKTGNST